MPRKRRRPGPGRPGGRLPWGDLYPTLDLHGETAESATARAERWLREQRAAGAPVVRLITGKGLHSRGVPVLPGEIAGLVERLKGSVVARAETEPGGGVLRVELRPQPAARPAEPPRREKTAARLPEDPELRRRAEESLAELGITPTPALLAAEMRRLRESGEG